MRQKQYPGKLGKPTPNRFYLAAQLRTNTDPDAVAEWRGKHFGQLLFELLDHYKIPRSDPSAWLTLALNLARDHVPAFTIREGRGPGRPRSPPTLADISRLGGIRKKPGRRTKWTERKYEALLRDVRKVAEAEGYFGKGAISKAISKIIRDAAISRNEAPEAAVRQELPHYRKRYSEAAKIFPSLALKSKGGI